MVKIISQVIESTTPPEQNNAQWLDISGEQPILKANVNGVWVPISGRTPTPTVKSVNNITPDSNGNVSINIPEVVNDTTTGGTTKAFSAEQGKNIKGELTELSAEVGDLSELETEAKDNLVEAINEAYNHGGETVNVVDNLTSDSSTDALSAKQGKVLNTALTALQAEVDDFVGAQTNFVGIVASTSALPTVTSPSWGLVGADIDELNAYVWNGTSWTQFGTKTYDFTDFSGLVDKMSMFSNTEEGGFHVVDSDGNIGMRYNENGLDAAKVSQHLMQLIGRGSVAGSVMGNTVEAGLYIVDQRLNVGVKVDKDGIHAPNILEYEIVES